MVSAAMSLGVRLVVGKSVGILVVASVGGEVGVLVGYFVGYVHMEKMDIHHALCVRCVENREKNTSK